jgi:hypothetical protein
MAEKKKAAGRRLSGAAALWIEMKYQLGENEIKI